MRVALRAVFSLGKKFFIYKKVYLSLWWQTYVICCDGYDHVFQAISNAEVDKICSIQPECFISVDMARLDLDTI